MCTYDVDWNGSWGDRRGTKEGLFDTNQNKGEPNSDSLYVQALKFNAHSKIFI